MINQLCNYGPLKVLKNNSGNFYIGKVLSEGKLVVGRCAISTETFASEKIAQAKLEQGTYK